ncbi:hypothetical protein GCM10007852_18490 [Agaribacter marinus]|uniref:Uncharacterized protein n=1 Tax=Agaribacter marinus TaxID=1431249 RepID=A0AA37SWE9_9ALTE|nr:hypothetical protein GCM10007852_18490 [Agaribacter marinus]
MTSVVSDARDEALGNSDVAQPDKNVLIVNTLKIETNNDNGFMLFSLISTPKTQLDAEFFNSNSY